MDTLPAPQPPVATPAQNPAFGIVARAEEEIPLGWECANPALQIECWHLERVPSLSSKS